MVSPGEISLLCRLCLVKDQVNVPIFGEQGDIRQIFLKISSCLPVTVSKEDQLPKNICEGCSDKLDLLFAFWNSSRDAEKTLVSWLKQASVDNANETINAIAKQISAKPVAEVKQETDDGQNIKIQQSSEEGKNDESEEAPPPPKRARRTAAVKAQISISQEDESEEEEDDVDAVEPLTKVEDESDMSDNDGADNQPLSSFVDMPGTSADDQEQAGPSGVGKDGGADAPLTVKPDLDAEEIYIQIVNDNNTDENKIEVEELENVPFSEEIKEEEEEEEEDDEENELEEGDLDESSSSPKPLAGKRSCNVCKQSYKFLSRHLEKHGSENCMDCLLNFPTSEKLAEHMQEVHNASTNYQCEVCDLTFSSLVQLGVHTFKHTKTYSCPLCNYTAKGNHKHSLINHIKRHEGKYSVFCDICGRGFFDKNILASHMEIHEDIPKYECEFCKKKFTVKRYLEVHKSLNHKKELFGIEESFQCEICGRNFTFEKSLIRHLSAIHKIGEDRRVNCPVCNKKIANNHNLKKHMRTHTGEKRFCCDECGKAFSEKKYLQKHQAGHVRQEERKRLFLEREKEKAARTRRMNRINRMRHQQMIREYQPPSPLSPPVAHPSFQERQELLQQQQLYQPSPQEYLNMMYRQQLLQGLNDPVGQDQEGFAFYSYDDE